MNTRNKLLNALNGLELSFKKKEEFVDTLLNNVPTDGDGESNLKYVRYTKSSKVILGFSAQIKSVCDNELYILPTITLAEMKQSGAFQSHEYYAFSIDLESKVLMPSLGQTELISLGQFLEKNDIDLAQLPYITEEEFYHIPKDEVWALYTQEDYKAAWDKLYPLVERCGASYINENKLSLAPWYKSLTLESEWGDISLSEIVEYYREFNNESKEDVIGFNGCALIKQYKDGDIIYRLSIYDS